MSSSIISSKSICTVLSVVVPALAGLLGPGSAVAQDQSPYAYRAGGVEFYGPPGAIAPGIYGYDPYQGGIAPAMYDYVPVCGINCGLPGGHSGSDYFKNGNGDHGNDGGNGG
jgi:hypothetical protein